MAKIYPVKNSVNLWARWTVPGHKETRKTTGVASKRLAQIKANEMEREDIEAKRIAAIGVVTFDEMIAWDVARAKTAETNEEEWKHTLPTYWGHVTSYFKCASEVNAATVTQYIAYRRNQLIAGKRQPSNVTIRHELRVLKRGMKLARINKRAEGLDLDVDLWPVLQKRDAQKLQTQAAELRHTRAQIVDWLVALEDEAQAEALLALLTGMRDGEMRRCTIERLSIIEGIGVYTVPGRKKGNSARQIAVTPFVQQLMRRFLPFKKQHKSARKGAARSLGFADWLHPPTLRNMRGLFISVAHEGKFSDSVIKTLAAHGEQKDSHHLYVGITHTSMLEVATFVENYWAPMLLKVFEPKLK